MGPIILDVIGTELSQEEVEILQHPLVAGVILFARNYVDPEQLTQLCRSIRQSRKKPLLIAVDHEGGRVQRFRTGFTRLPSMGEIGVLYGTDTDEAQKLAQACGRLMALELLAVGIDLSFAPVLDLDKKANQVIGNRAFHSNPELVIILAKALVQGMNSAGMAATGKHFPGHGGVEVDSHLALPIDIRTYENISDEDMRSFSGLIQLGIQALMPAHIVFPAIDHKPVGFSAIWLQDILRKQLQFTGVVFSDDLNMEGAGFAGDYASRAQSALEAGCDMALICNNRPGAIQILDTLGQDQYALSDDKFKSLQGRFTQNYKELRQTSFWQGDNEYVTRRLNDDYAR